MILELELINQGFSCDNISVRNYTFNCLTVDETI